MNRSGKEPNRSGKEPNKLNGGPREKKLGQTDWRRNLRQWELTWRLNEESIQLYNLADCVLWWQLLCLERKYVGKLLAIALIINEL